MPSISKGVKTIIIKFGGSIISNKAVPYSFNENVTRKLAHQLKECKDEYVLVHGAGSFGHILAKKHKLNEGLRNNEQLQGFALTHVQVQQLNSLVLEALHEENIPGVSIPPHAWFTLDNHEPTAVDYSFFDQYLKTGFTPVTFGDVILDARLGFSICSGDLLMVLLAQHYNPTKVVFWLPMISDGDNAGQYRYILRRKPPIRCRLKTAV